MPNTRALVPASPNSRGTDRTLRWMHPAAESSWAESCTNRSLQACTRIESGTSSKPLGPSVAHQSDDSLGFGGTAFSYRAHFFACLEFYGNPIERHAQIFGKALPHRKSILLQLRPFENDRRIHIRYCVSLGSGQVT